MIESEQYQDDNACSDRNHCDINIEVEGHRGNRVAGNNSKRDFYQDESTEDKKIPDEISLFDGGEPLILTDIDCPYAFDSDSEEIRMENVRQVAMEYLKTYLLDYINKIVSK